METTSNPSNKDMIETLASIWITADRSITREWIEKSQMAKVADVYDVAMEKGWSLTYWELRDLAASVVDRVMRHYYQSLCLQGGE